MRAVEHQHEVPRYGERAWLVFPASLPLFLALTLSGCTGSASGDGVGAGTRASGGNPAAGQGGGGGGMSANAGGGSGAAGTPSAGAGERPSQGAGGGGQIGDGVAGRVGGNAGAAPVGAGGTGGSAGQATAGGTTGNAGGAGTKSAPYMIGADITSTDAAEAGGATFSDGTKKNLLQLLKSHGFNFIRLRSFVDPEATDGYDKQNGFADLAHTVAFGKRIKDAELGFLLDLHYSDNWADPGKQCVPVAWQGFTTIAQLAGAVHDYTRNAIAELVAGGARPDIVQIGNEITPGMLIHVCDSTGKPTGNNRVTGSVANWTNLGALLKAGVQGVKDVDAGIEIMLHIDRGGDKGGYTGAALETSASFITNARKQGVVFDLFGESCYQTYQGDAASTANTVVDWTKTFMGLTGRFPDLRFVAAEYGPMQREINDVVFGLANARGAGTFVWEPSEQGDWNTGHSLFTASGNAFTATADLSLYDEMKTAYASRL